MKISWQEIVEKVRFAQSKKFVRETVLVYYSAFESNIDYECNIYIRNIGRFKGSPAGIRRRNAIKTYKKSKIRFCEKNKKRRQRLWIKQKFDDRWKD